MFVVGQPSTVWVENGLAVCHFESMTKLPPTLADLPYRIHTNRELGFMLRGTKPLAVFCDWHGPGSDVIERYLRMFDRHVDRGDLVKRQYDHWPPDNDRPPVWVILYALPGQEWRIDEMIQLRSRMYSGTNWSAEDERLQGRLLGYEEWQNDIWIATRFGRAPAR
jgi:hypothetical protein